MVEIVMPFSGARRISTKAFAIIALNLFFYFFNSRKEQQTMKNIILAILAIAMLAAASVSYADIPPPPVNQDLGLPDGNFDNLVEAQCEACHVDRALSNFSSFDQLDVPSRHHATIARDNNECMDCHDLVYNPVTMSTELDIFRDCQHCHIDGRPGLDGVIGNYSTWILVPGSPHHRTPFAKAKQCYRCHGSTVNNAETITHDIPTYAKTMVTPNTCRDNLGQPGIEQCSQTEIDNHDYNSCPIKDPVTGQCIGGCQSCHKAGTVAGYVIGENDSNHHNTTLGINDDNECKFCHGNALLGEDILDIRKCEECHGISTLHNIMVNYTGNAGSHGYGHVGTSQDCAGCHGYFAQYDIAPGAGAYVPQINTVSNLRFAVGVAASITIEGLGFINDLDLSEFGGPVVNFSSDVVIDDLAGNAITIAPDSITNTVITATVPGTLAAGTYYLYLSKADKVSGMYAITVDEPVVVTSATQSGSDIIITGSNFGPAPEQGYVSAIGVYVTKDGVTEKADIVSWTATEIIARSTLGCGDITVQTVLGTATGTAACETKGNKGKGKGNGKNK